MIHVLSNPRRELLLRAETIEEALSKIRMTCERYPEESRRYVADGFRMVEADSVAAAKRKFEKATITDRAGQIKLF